MEPPLLENYSMRNKSSKKKLFEFLSGHVNSQQEDIVECRLSQNRRKIGFETRSDIWLAIVKKYIDFFPQCSPISEAVKQWFSMLSLHF